MVGQSSLFKDSPVFAGETKSARPANGPGPWRAGSRVLGDGTAVLRFSTVRPVRMLISSNDV
jgi:hypothetical protein